MISIRHTEATFAEQGICIFQRRCFPLRVLKVVCQESLCRSLLSIPGSHAPETLEDGFLLQGKVEQAAINGVLNLALCILVASDDLELRPLRVYSVSCQNKYNLERRTYHGIGISQPHKHPTLSSILP